MVWAAQILCGNAILGYSVVFLQQAGFSEVQAFNVNISLSACYSTEPSHKATRPANVPIVIGGIICWLLFPHFGRFTIYFVGLLLMFVTLVVIGGLGFASGKGVSLAIGIILVVQTLINMITTGPGCYPIVAETPSGRLRYKTIAIGRFTYNLTGIFNNSVTPRMLSPLGTSRTHTQTPHVGVASRNNANIKRTGWNWGARAALFYAGTNLLCTIWCWFRLPETKDRSFGEIDLLFDNRVHARKFKHTSVDRKFPSSVPLLSS